MDLFTPKRVAIYARVSTEEQAEHGYSIDAQKEALRQYCELYKKTIVDEYVDAGISGKEMTKRLELQRLLKDAETGKFDEVLVWKINRMSRNTKDLLEIVDRLRKYGVDFSSLSEKFDTSGPMGRFALQMLAAVGELERNTIVENVKLGLKQRARMGLHSGCRALGYRVASKDDTSKRAKNDLVIIEDEAVIVRKIFELFCNGKGFKAIANQLNHEGYKTWKGKDFSLCSIREIVDNPLYKGYVRYGKYENWSEKRRKGKNLNPILVKGRHEAIVSEEVWNKAAKMRGMRKKVTARAYTSENILSSILKCPECGAPMVIARSRYKIKDGTIRINRFYSCSTFKNKGSAVCHSNSVDADEAEKYVISKIKEFLSNEGLVQKVFERVKTKTESQMLEKQKELAGIETKLEDLQKRKSKIMDLYLEGGFDKEMLDSRVEELNVNIEQLSNLRNSLIVDAGIPTEVLNSEYINTILVRFENVITSASSEQKHMLLKLLIDRITVKDHKVDKVYLKLGGELQQYLNNLSPSPDKKVGGLFLYPNRNKGCSVATLILEI